MRHEPHCQCAAVVGVSGAPEVGGPATVTGSDPEPWALAPSSSEFKVPANRGIRAAFVTPLPPAPGAANSGPSCRGTRAPTQSEPGHFGRRWKPELAVLAFPRGPPTRPGQAKLPFIVFDGCFVLTCSYCPAHFCGMGIKLRAVASEQELASALHSSLCFSSH
jgi:hypothetical protein